jgi:hypothetical protein
MWKIIVELFKFIFNDADKSIDDYFKQEEVVEEFDSPKNIRKNAEKLMKHIENTSIDSKPTEYRIIKKPYGGSYFPFLQFKKDSSWYYVPGENYPLYQNGLPTRNSGFTLLIMRTDGSESFLEYWAKQYPYIDDYLNAVTEKSRAEYEEEQEELRKLRENPVRYL